MWTNTGKVIKSLENMFKRIQFNLHFELVLLSYLKKGFFFILGF